MPGSIPDTLRKFQLGPFVDINNDLIKEGAVTDTSVGYFQQYMASKFDALFNSVPGISIFLVPSVRDIIHDHIAFPQNALNKAQLGLSNVCQPLPLCYSGTAVKLRHAQNIHVLPNPCVFTVNGVNIGVCSVDILSHIGAQQYSRHIKTLPESLDGVQLLALQLLEQRRHVLSREMCVHFVAHTHIQFLPVISCSRQRGHERQP